VDLAALAARLSSVGEVAANDYLVRFKGRDAQMVVFGDGRAIVKASATRPRRERSMPGTWAPSGVRTG
jgi:hypothetical protein